MIFYEIVDIEKMLDSTQDPIADIINSLCADVIQKWFSFFLSFFFFFFFLKFEKKKYENENCIFIIIIIFFFEIVQI